jgi:hypothetical protein
LLTDALAFGAAIETRSEERMAMSVRRGTRVLILMGCLGPALARAAETPAGRWIAADAAIYVEVSRPNLLIDTAMRPQVQGALRVLPPVQRYLESAPYRTLRTVADLVAEKLGTTLEEGLKRLTAGGITLAVEGAATQGGPPRVLLIVTPDEAEFGGRAVEALVALARQDAANKGNPDPVKSAEYRDVRGYSLGKTVLALVEGSLVFAERSETIKTVVDRARDGMKEPGAIVDDADWKARRARVRPDTLAWGFARLEKLRALDPKRFQLAEKSPAQAMFLFGSWLEALRTAPWIEAALSARDERLAASVSLPAPTGGYRAPLQGFVPSRDAGAPALVSPPGTIANLSLWRDLSAIWEARSELFTPEVQQGLTKLDGFAGQFFGGRDFGSGVLGALGPRWRLVVAHQDYEALSPRPDLKLPGIAVIAELNPDDEEFSERLKVAFQSFVGLVNLNTGQKGQPPLELGSETFEGTTISTARYMVPKAEAGDGAKEPVKTAVHPRYNATPSIAQVGNHFILSSSVGLTRALIAAMKHPGARADTAPTLAVEADGPALARLVTLNRQRLIMQNMLDKGHDEAAAEAEVDGLGRLLKSLDKARLTVEDRPETLRFDLGLTLANPD